MPLYGVGVGISVGVDIGVGFKVGVDVGAEVGVANTPWILLHPPASRKNRPNMVTKTAYRDFACAIRALYSWACV